MTDAMWSWGRPRRVERRLWEVKTGSADAIPREWVNQVLGQVAGERQTSRLRVVGCLVTNLSGVESEATPAARELCLLHHDAIQALADLMGDRLIEYAERSGAGSAAERGAAREALEPRIPVGDWLAELLGPSEGGGIVRRERVRQMFG